MTQDRSQRPAAVCFIEVVGFNELFSRDEELGRRVVHEMWRRAEVVCDAWGGRVVRFFDYAVSAVFDSADGAVRAAVRLRDGYLASPPVRQAGVSLKAGVGFGEVTEEAGGDIVGDPVSVAGSLKRAAGPGQLLLCAETYRALEQPSALRLHHAGECEVGRMGTVRFYEASGIG